MQKYFEINRDGHNIRCKLYADKPADIRKLVMFFHGFAGHKDTATAEKFADRLLSKYKGTGVMIFNWPSHGDDVKKKITLSDCMSYLSLAVSYAKQTWNDPALYAYAASFGAYAVLKYICEHGSPFRKILLRSPAVNMYDSLTGTLMTDADRAELQKGRPVTVGFDRKIEVTPQFVGELRDADIRQTEFLDYADDLMIIHGTADEIIPFETVKTFAEENVIELLPVEGADHRFRNPAHTELATKTVLRFFEF